MNLKEKSRKDIIRIQLTLLFLAFVSLVFEFWIQYGICLLGNFILEGVDLRLKQC